MSNFEWIEFYSEFATVLLQYENDRATLIEKVKEIFINANMPTLESDNKIVDIVDMDPFTIFALFNRYITKEYKLAILARIKMVFSLSANIPKNFNNTPILSSSKWVTFYRFPDERGTNDIDNLWTLFRCAILYADHRGSELDFRRAFNTVGKQGGSIWNITMGLYWVRPLTFIYLNKGKRKLLKSNQHRFEPDIDIEKILIHNSLSAENYLFLMRKLKEISTEDTVCPEQLLDAGTSAEEEENTSYPPLSEEFDSSDNEIMDNTMTDIAKNTIFYGPPGTGKTYHTVVYAVAIVENKSLDSIQAEATTSYPDVLERYKRYKTEGLIEFTTFHQSYGYEEFIEGIKPVMDNTDNSRSDIQYSIEDGLFKAFCNKSIMSAKRKNRVFIIDEINRGNISKIFGELITLIEPSKRMGQPEEIQVKLPYSQKPFGVPNDVYIIGTMNTADRSIATIDTALRRRFHFKEMMPDVSVLEDIRVKDISVPEMLERMNKRISVLYDREHTIGHAYFIPLRDNPTTEQLAEIFENAIIPLLQEYFYEDYEKIRLVLGDNNKSSKEDQFIVAVENDYYELFGSTDIGFDDSVTYEINRAAFKSIDAYRSI